jgi:predicted transcriptional regulator
MKTTVYLDAGDYRRLKALAKAQGRTTAELVREAVATYARAQQPSARPASIAAGRSGRSDLAERSEELLDGMGRHE